MARLGRAGFTLATTVADPEDREVPVVALFRDARGRRIDFLIAKTPFEESALARATQTVRPGSRDVAIVTPEDLIVFKLIAGRSRDLLDVVEVIRTLEIGGRAIDWPYVERWSDDWDVRDRLERLRADLAAGVE